MNRTIEEIMYLVGGIDPFKKYEIYGKGGLGYVPTPYNMVGGMAFVDPDNPKKITDEHIKQYQDEGFDIDDYGEFIDLVTLSSSPDEVKVQKLLEQYTDLDKIERDNNARGIHKDETLDKEIKKYKEKIERFLESDEKYLEQTLERPYKQPKKNLLFEMDEEEAKNEFPGQYEEAIQSKNEKRGDIFELEVTQFDEDIGILQNLDKDSSPSVNSKELEPYTDEFLKYALSKLGIDKEVDELTDDDIEILKDKILKFVPIDIIKDNTLWELKSFDNNISNKMGFQMMGISKMDKSKIYDSSNPRINFDLQFRYTKVGDDWLVKNIYLTKGSKEFPILKNSNFKYYWMWNNPDYIGYYNPLKNRKFTPSRIERTKLYEFDWEDPEDILHSKKIVIPNSEIQIYPNRYSKKFKSKIKSFKP